MRPACCALSFLVLSSGCLVAERLGPTSVMEGALLVEVGEKVVMRRIELADRQTNGVVLAVRPADIAAVVPDLNSSWQFVIFGMLCTGPPVPTTSGIMRTLPKTALQPAFAASMHVGSWLPSLCRAPQSPCIIIGSDIASMCS